MRNATLQEVAYPSNFCIFPYVPACEKETSWFMWHHRLPLVARQCLPHSISASKEDFGVDDCLKVGRKNTEG